VLTQLGHECGELGAGRLRQCGTPRIVTGKGQLADRPNPGLERNDRLGWAARQHDGCAVGVSLARRCRGVTRLADPRLSEDQHRAPPRPRRRLLAQHRDLAVPADQRLLGVGGEDRRQSDMGRRIAGLASWRTGIVDLRGRDAVALRRQHQLTPAQS
jgi:hypothetical protein